MRSSSRGLSEWRLFLLIVDSIDISRSQLEALIDEWILGKDAERNRKILKRRLIDGITFEQLAEEFDLSVQRTKAIVYKQQDRLFAKMK